MALRDDEVKELIFGTGRGRRYTQDSPVMPDVWLAYGRDDDVRVDLLLTPHTGAAPGELAAELHRRTSKAQVAQSDTYVVARLTLEELVTAALPLTAWWNEKILGEGAHTAHDSFLAGWLAGGKNVELAPQVRWLIDLVGRLGGHEQDRTLTAKEIDAVAADMLEKSIGTSAAAKKARRAWKPLLWLVSRNRPAQLAISRSRLAVKADAAVQLFNIDCSSLAWAVIDCGVDAGHPALRARDKKGKLVDPPFQA